MAGLEGEICKRGVKIIGISVDLVASHDKWKDDIKTATGFAVEYPLIGDRELKVAKLYDMLPAGAGDIRGPHAGRQRDGAPGLRDRPGQEDQARADLSDDHGPQLRRDPARDRFHPAHSQHQVATPAN